MTRRVYCTVYPDTIAAVASPELTTFPPPIIVSSRDARTAASAAPQTPRSRATGDSDRRVPSTSATFRFGTHTPITGEPGIMSEREVDDLNDGREVRLLVR